jgi:hypothetical protein
MEQIVAEGKGVKDRSLSFIVELIKNFWGGDNPPETLMG